VGANEVSQKPKVKSQKPKSPKAQKPFLLQCRDPLWGEACMKRPSLGALLLGLIPFIGTCFSVPLWDRVHPTVLGLPFNFFWLTAWLLLTPVFMWGAYRLEEPRAPGARRKQGGVD
jgi:hypothetical protein